MKFHSRNWIIDDANVVLMHCFCHVTGAFFQWVFCIAIWTTGFVLNGIRLFPQFLPLSMLGGFLWCTGERYLWFVYRWEVVCTLQSAVYMCLLTLRVFVCFFVVSPCNCNCPNCPSVYACVHACLRVCVYQVMLWLCRYLRQLGWVKECWSGHRSPCWPAGQLAGLPDFVSVYLSVSL